MCQNKYVAANTSKAVFTQVSQFWYFLHQLVFNQIRYLANNWAKYQNWATCVNAAQYLYYLFIHMPFIMNPVFSFVWLGFILFITVKSYRMKLNDFSILLKIKTTNFLSILTLEDVFKNRLYRWYTMKHFPNPQNASYPKNTYQI